MKLVELLQHQEIIIQLVWEKHKIEFTSNVIEKDETAIYITPYINNGCELELNVTSDENVVCNVFANDPITEQRISWKGISLTTVTREQEKVYCLMTHTFNAMSCPDDRRLHERVEIQVGGHLLDGEEEERSITVHDISDNGVSFYVPGNYEPKSLQLRVSFTDSIDEREFDINVECSIARIHIEGERTLVGCRVLVEDNDYRIYELLKRLRKKHHVLTKKVESENTNMEDKVEAVVA